MSLKISQKILASHVLDFFFLKKKMIFFWNTILTSICRPLIDELGSFNMSDDTIHGAGLSPEQYRSLKNSSKIHKGWNSTLHFLQHSIQTINPLLSYSFGILVVSFNILNILKWTELAFTCLNPFYTPDIFVSICMSVHVLLQLLRLIRAN